MPPEETAIGLYSQPLAAFGATSGQYLTSVFGSHASAEAVVTLTLQIARLECAFHGGIPAVEVLRGRGC